MLRKLIACAVVAAAAFANVSTASATIGSDPIGSFEITVKQGGNTIVNDTVTIGAGGELEDLKWTGQDGDPEDHTQIGTIGNTDNPVILKVTTEGSPNFRLTHWYIDVPVSTANIHAPGPVSLFDPFGGNIDVTVTGLEWDDGASLMPLVLPSPNFYTSFMRDWHGHFYESVSANSFNQFGNGLYDIQVPGSAYHDADMSEYTFDVMQSGTSTSWTWGNIVNPSLLTPVNNGLGATVMPYDPGYVFELGLAVAFVPSAPEPGTISLLAAAAIPLLRRRRRC